LELGKKLDEILISVCLLTYNHAHMIESTIASIQHQTIKGYEIIVSDDCSTDNTWEILQALAAEDPRILPVRTPRNLGMPGNANFAVAQSDRPYIALLHHDDLARSDLLEKWLAVMKRHPHVGFVFNAYGVDNSDFVYRENLPDEWINGCRFLESFLFPRWGCAVRGTAMFRRDAWEAVGGMRVQFGLLADIDLWMRLSMRWAVGYEDEPIIILRQDRPDDYPEEYKGNRWSWPRQRYLYEIHAANRIAYLDLRSIAGRLKWWIFRLRLSMETAKWLMYAVVRHRPEMLTSSQEGSTAYDFLPLHGLRRLLQIRYNHKRE
jgi:glycosyltransferase involved in cell wall biosynthesis